MRALEAIRVLDLSRFIAGPFCCQILGDHGADVVKVEKLDGEPARAIPPFLGGESLYYMAYNGSKRGIAINLRSPDGLALLRRLVEKTDVVVENFRAGTMEQMGLGYERLARINPRVILVSVSGFGVEGPYAARPAFDEIIQGVSGLASLTGEPGGPPMLTATFVADFVTGLYGAVAALLALQHRSQTGRGQWVRTNLFHSLVSVLNTSVSRFIALGEVPRRTGNRNANVAPGNVYRTRDGYVTVECITQEMWEGLARAMDRADLLQDPRYRDGTSRFQNALSLDRDIESWMESRSVGEVLETLHRHSVPAGPVLDIPALVKEPQFLANHMLTTVTHPTVGEVPLLTPPITLTGDAAARRGRPPRLGEHTEEVLTEWLALPSAEIASLYAAGVLRHGPPSSP
jgi:crotonobetainyl-CoA:carnitine CoA-transferase CaiB-like acyl-CoA transferase